MLCMTYVTQANTAVTLKGVPAGGFTILMNGRALSMWSMDEWQDAWDEFGRIVGGDVLPYSD
jgi:hypothetical protein